MKDFSSEQPREMTEFKITAKYKPFRKHRLGTWLGQSKRTKKALWNSAKPIMAKCHDFFSGKHNYTGCKSPQGGPSVFLGQSKLLTLSWKFHVARNNSTKAESQVFETPGLKANPSAWMSSQYCIQFNAFQSTYVVRRWWRGMGAIEKSSLWANQCGETRKK